MLFCGYVVFDTQMIIEKASTGDKDVLKHTLDLFMGTGRYAIPPRPVVNCMDA